MEISQQNKNSKTGSVLSPSDLLKSIMSDISGSRVSSAIYFLFFLHGMFLVMRFQDFPLAGWLGTIRFPGLLSAVMSIVGIAAFFQIPKARKQFFVKLVIPFLVFEGIRGIVGFYILEDWVLNDAWQFNAWLVLITYFISFMIPMVGYISNGKGLRLLIGSMTLMGIILGLYSLTHVGFGPGGHIGDENDNCLFLVSLLPFPFYYMSYKRGWGFSRLVGLSSFFLLLLGIVRTNSRGGFIGLVAVVFVFFLVSRKKVLWLGSGLVLMLAALPFIPEEYWGEVKSIQTDSSSNSGTIRERLDTWAIVVRMWKDPRNTIFGVGLENTKWNSYLYEPEGAGYTLKSLAGRATHSFYFQVLGDLGIWGILIFGGLIFHSLRSLRMLYKLANTLEAGLHRINLDNMISKALETDNQKPQTSSDFSNLKKTRQLLLTELRFLKGGPPAIFSAWFGMLFAAIGISVAYYPSFWMYCALTASFAAYGDRLKNHCLEFEKAVIQSAKTA